MINGMIILFATHTLHFTFFLLMFILNSITSFMPKNSPLTPLRLLGTSMSLFIIFFNLRYLTYDFVISISQASKSISAFTYFPVICIIAIALCISYHYSFQPFPLFQVYFPLNLCLSFLSSVLTFFLSVSRVK